jgi:hypothetical protein
MPDKPKAPPSAEQLAQLKKKVLADPNTKKLAETVKMPLEEYVETVMKYLANPSLEPQVYVAEDADLKRFGYTPPDPQKIAAYINEHAEAQEVSMKSKSKFADPNSQRERVTGKLPAIPAATAKPEEVREDLKEEVNRGRTTGKFRKL